MVAGRVAEFWSADAVTLGNLLHAAICVHLGGGLTWPAAVASAVARELGRVEEVARTRDVALELVERRTELSSWPRTLDSIMGEIGFEPEEATPVEVEHGFRHNMGELFWAVLATEVVADRLNPSQRLHGRGPWLTGLAPAGDLPGPQWRAPRQVIDRLVAPLQRLGAAQLREIVLRHGDDDLGDYQTLAGRLEGWAVVTPAGCPWKGVLARLPGVRADDRMGALGSIATAPSTRRALQQWATVMTSAACHRGRLSPSDVAALTAPVLDLLPELPSVVDG
jgi:hypothetical protein